MSRFYLNQTIARKRCFSILDEQGNEVYLAQAARGSMGQTLLLCAPDGTETGRIRRGASLRPLKFEVCLPGRDPFTVRRQWRFPQAGYRIEGPGWQVEGNVFRHEFIIRGAGEEIARIRRDGSLWKDRYEVEVRNEEEQTAVLMIVLAMDWGIALARSAAYSVGA